MIKYEFETYRNNNIIMQVSDKIVFKIGDNTYETGTVKKIS